MCMCYVNSGDCMCLVPAVHRFIGTEHKIIVMTTITLTAVSLFYWKGSQGNLCDYGKLNHIYWVFRTEVPVPTWESLCQTLVERSEVCCQESAHSSQSMTNTLRLTPSLLNHLLLSPVPHIWLVLLSPSRFSFPLFHFWILFTFACFSTASIPSNLGSWI